MDWKSREILRKISVNYELFCSLWPVLDSGTESRAGGGTSLFFPLDFWWLLQEITSRHSSPCAFGAVIDANLLQSNLLFIPQKSEAAKERREGYFGSPENFPSLFLTINNNLKASLENFWWMIPTPKGVIEPHRN